MKKSKGSGWLIRRLEKLPENATTSEVVKVLKISENTVRSWMQRPEFINNRIATPNAYGYFSWDKDKLKVWITAIQGIEEKGILENPPEGSMMTRAEARSRLGMKPVLHE